MFSKKEFAIDNNFRFISMANFMLSWVEQEKVLEPRADLISYPTNPIVLHKVHICNTLESATEIKKE